MQNNKEEVNQIADKLIEIAIDYRKNAYVPYSNFAVGAAVLTESGNIYGGCNVENASFGLTNCAERTAIFTAIANGESKITEIAIVGGKKDGELTEQCTPCGACRQVIAEFMEADGKIILSDNKTTKIYSLREMLPYGFEL